MGLKNDSVQFFRTEFTNEQLKDIAKSAGYGSYSEMARHILTVISKKGVPLCFDLTGKTCSNLKSFRANKKLGKAMTKACAASFASKACVFEQCLIKISEGFDLEELNFPKQMLR